jgi:aspartokinase
MTSDPNKDDNAKTIYRMKYDDAIEMSMAGANVLHHNAVKYAKHAETPIFIKNTFNPNFIGTEISNNRVFSDVLKEINNDYFYSPNGFVVGENKNDSSQNQGAARVLSYAKLKNLSLQQTLELFCEHYIEVLDTKNSNSHQNIRELIKCGLEGVKFDDDVLVLRSKNDD